MLNLTNVGALKAPSSRIDGGEGNLGINNSLKHQETTINNQTQKSDIVVDYQNWTEKCDFDEGEDKQINNARLSNQQMNIQPILDPINFNQQASDLRHNLKFKANRIDI